MRTTTILSLVLTMLAAGAALAAGASRSVWDGAYTAAQAQAGASRYAQQCARCHGAELYGTSEVPSLRGQLIARWAGTTLDGLSGYINHAMPMQSPGALPAADNAEILAFILQANGAPAGDAALPTDPAALKAIMLAPKPRRP